MTAMTKDHATALMDLPAKWREEVEHAHDAQEWALLRAKLACADELIAALAYETHLSQAYADLRASGGLPEAQGGAHEPLDVERFAKRIENYRNEEYQDDDSYAVDIMEDLLKALRAASGGAQGWQPIATAPKDGTPVLLWWPHWSRQAIVGWVDKFGRWASEIALSEGTDPTHWMPLPVPPTGETP